MKEVRYGVIGLGNIGTIHVENFMTGKVPNAVLTAIADLKKDRVDRIVNKYPEVEFEVFNSSDALIEKADVDAIIVATPHFSHAEITIKALNKGIHVISEKPAGVYTNQVKEMINTAKSSTALLTVMFNQRTNPVYKKMREIIMDGGIGDIIRVNWTITNWFRTQNYYDSGDWRGTWSGEGGGVLYNQCPHQLDLLSWLVGKNPKSVRAFCHFGKWHDIEVEDEVTAYFEYDNGATGIFITTTGECPGTNRFEVSGTKGKLVIEDNSNDLIWCKCDEDTQVLSKNATSGFQQPKVERVKVETDGKSEQHVGIINNFTNALLGKEEFFVDGVEGIKGVELMNAIELSGWRGGATVTLPVNEEEYLYELNEKRKTSRIKVVNDNYIEQTVGTYGGK